MSQVTDTPISFYIYVYTQEAKFRLYGLIKILRSGQSGHGLKFSLFEKSSIKLLMLIIFVGEDEQYVS